MANELVVAASFGFLGGVVRALVGISKNVWKAKKKFELNKVLFTVIAAGIIGIFTGLLFGTDYKLALVAGYAGTDLLEGAVKVSK